MAYSLDLREKVVLYFESGRTRVSASKVFGIGERTVRRWVLRYRSTGNIAPLPHGGGFPSKIQSSVFKQHMADNPDKTLKELEEFFGVSHAGIAYNLRKHGYVHKKTLLYAKILYLRYAISSIIMYFSWREARGHHKIFKED